MKQNYKTIVKSVYLSFIFALFIQTAAIAQCFTPEAPTVGSITNSTAQLNFSSTIATSIIEWGKAGFTPTTTTTGNLISSSGYKSVNNVNTFTIAGLEANTTYDIYVRRNCGGGALSANCPKVSFTTTNNCSAENVPFFESFSTVAYTGNYSGNDYSLPECTRSINNITDQKWRVKGYGNGLFALGLKGMNGYPNEAIYITKGINLSAGVPYKVEFDSNGIVSFYASMSIPEIINNTMSTGTGGVFTPTVSGVYYFGFYGEVSGTATLLLANISIKDITNPCPTPTGLSATGISSSAISVSYTSAVGNSCVIEYTPIYGGNTQTVLSASSPHVVSGLIPNRLYRFRIRRQCATNSLSDWSPVFSGSTLDCSSAPAVISTDFVTSNSARINWQSSAAANSYEVFYTTNAAFTPASDTPSNAGSLETNIFLTGLNSNTTYYYFVRSDCGAVISAWSTVRQFKTAVASNCNSAEDLFPLTAFTPSCTGTLEPICYAKTGEVTMIDFSANKQYTFTSSTASDYITIANTLGVVYASGQSPLVWSSGTNSGILTYVIHTNSGCGTDFPELRIKYISCSNSTAACASPFGLTAGNISNDAAVLT